MFVALCAQSQIGLFMHVALLCTPATAPTAAWVSRELRSRGHHLDDAAPTLPDAGAAAAVGHHLADRWASERPDVVLALGWEAGLSAHVGARAGAVDVPVLLRLTRAGRDPGSDRDRLELALARGSRRVLVPSAGELDRLVERGVRRAVLRVLPEAVDPAQFVDVGAELPASAAYRVALARPDGRHEDYTVLGLPGMPAYDVVPVPADGMDETGLADRLRSVHAMVVTDDSDAEVALTLRAMSCAVPVVAVTTGTLADVVADDVTGVLVRRTSDVPLALRSLLSDPIRRQSMGLAAVDRVRARFDTAVVGAGLESALLDVLPRSVAVAS